MDPYDPLARPHGHKDMEKTRDMEAPSSTNWPHTQFHLRPVYIALLRSLTVPRVRCTPALETNSREAPTQKKQGHVTKP